MCPDYMHYPLSLECRLRFIGMILIAGMGSGMLFYHRILPGIFLTLMLAGFYPTYCSKERKKRRAALRMAFRDVLYALSSSVSSGRPMEEALTEARRFCQSAYEESDDILMELDYMLRRIRQGRENDLIVLRDFAVRSGISDIADFVNVYEICKSAGGNLARAINRAASVIGDKINLQTELETLMAQKAYESRVVGCAPFAMVLMIRLTAPEYLLALQESSSGFWITTAAVGLIAAGFWMMERMYHLEI